MDKRALAVVLIGVLPIAGLSLMTFAEGSVVDGVMLAIHGGILLAAALAVGGVASGRAALSLAGAILLALASIPLLMGRFAPLAILAAAAATLGARLADAASRPARALRFAVGAVAVAAALLFLFVVFPLRGLDGMFGARFNPYDALLLLALALAAAAAWWPLKRGATAQG